MKPRRTWRISAPLREATITVTAMDFPSGRRVAVRGDVSLDRRGVRDLIDALEAAIADGYV